MMRQGITMITKFVEENVSEYNYNFPYGECIINASFKRLDNWENTAKTASDMIKEQTLLFRENIKVYLWLKSEPITNPSKLRRFKGIWNNPGLGWLKKEQCLLYSHITGGTEFYSATARIMETQLYFCVDYIRIHKDAFLFVVNDEKDINILDDYLYLNYSDFEKVINFSFNQNFVFFKASGNFDDNKLEIDLFGHRCDIAKLIKTNT